MRAAAALAATIWLGSATPDAFAAPSVLERDATAVLGTMPAYPGSTRPLPSWETRRLAIAMTGDKPEAVIAYYLTRLPATRWHAAPGCAAEAMAAAAAGAPAWLTFTQAGLGRLDLQITEGKHPTSGAPTTVIFYQRSKLLN